MNGGSMARYIIFSITKYYMVCDIINQEKVDNIIKTI